MRMLKYLQNQHKTDESHEKYCFHNSIIDHLTNQQERGVSISQAWESIQLLFSQSCELQQSVWCLWKVFLHKCEHCLLAKINKFWQWVVLHKWLPKLKFKKQNKDNYAHDDTHTLHSYPKKWAIQNVCVFQLWVLNSRWYVCPILTSTHKSIRIKNSNPTSSSLD